MKYNKYDTRIGQLIVKHERLKGLTSDSFLFNSHYHFYYKRLKALPLYGLIQGRELIKMICRCAFNDSSLTDNEAIVIMETCLDPALDNILLEVNFNEGW